MDRTQAVTDPATLEGIDRQIKEVEDKFETRLRDASAEDRVDIQREKNNALAELNRKKITGTATATSAEVEAERERLHPYEKAPPKEKEGLSQNVKDQLSSAEQWDAGNWMGEVKDDGQTTFGNIMSDGSQESGAAKAAREAKEKKEAENAKKPKDNTVQTRLGRDAKGRRLPGYGGKIPKGKLSDFRLDEGQGYGEFKDGGEGNVAEHEKLVAEKDKEKREAISGKQTGLGDFS